MRLKQGSLMSKDSDARNSLRRSVQYKSAYGMDSLSKDKRAKENAECLELIRKLKNTDQLVTIVSKYSPERSRSKARGSNGDRSIEIEVRSEERSASSRGNTPRKVINKAANYLSRIEETMHEESTIFQPSNRILHRNQASPGTSKSAKRQRTLLTNREQGYSSTPERQRIELVFVQKNTEKALNPHLRVSRDSITREISVTKVVIGSQKKGSNYQSNPRVSKSRDKGLMYATEARQSKEIRQPFNTYSKPSRESPYSSCNRNQSPNQANTAYDLNREQNKSSTIKEIHMKTEGCNTQTKTDSLKNSYLNSNSARISNSRERIFAKNPNLPKNKPVQEVKANNPIVSNKSNKLMGYKKPVKEALKEPIERQPTCLIPRKIMKELIKEASVGKQPNERQSSIKQQVLSKRWNEPVMHSKLVLSSNVEENPQSNKKTKKRIEGSKLESENSKKPQVTRNDSQEKSVYIEVKEESNDEEVRTEKKVNRFISALEREPIVKEFSSGLPNPKTRILPAEKDLSREELPRFRREEWHGSRGSKSPSSGEKEIMIEEEEEPRSKVITAVDSFKNIVFINSPEDPRQPGEGQHNQAQSVLNNLDLLLQTL